MRVRVWNSEVEENSQVKKYRVLYFMVNKAQKRLAKEGNLSVHNLRFVIFYTCRRGSIDKPIRLHDEVVSARGERGPTPLVRVHLHKPNFSTVRGRRALSGHHYTLLLNSLVTLYTPGYSLLPVIVSVGSTQGLMLPHSFNSYIRWLQTIYWQFLQFYPGCLCWMSSYLVAKLCRGPNKILKMIVVMVLGVDRCERSRGDLLGCLIDVS